MCLLLFLNITYASDSFYTISICTSSTYDDAVKCKNTVLKNQPLDINIIKVNSNQYRTNYGSFGTYGKAHVIEKSLNNRIKKNGVFIIKVDQNITTFEFCEIFKNNSVEKILPGTDSSNQVHLNTQLSEKEKLADLNNSSKSIETGNIKVLPETKSIDQLHSDKNHIKIPIMKIPKEETIGPEGNLSVIQDNNRPNKFEVSDKEIISYGKTDNANKIIYLTFDDGPMNGTMNIIETAKKESIPITLFFVGRQIEAYKNIYNTALSSDLVSIGNHTYAHANGKYKNFYLSPPNVLKDITKNNIIVSRAKASKTSSKFLPVRLAGRNVFRANMLSRDDLGLPKNQRQNEIPSYNILAKEGFYLYGWDVEWLYELNGKPIESPFEIVRQIEKVHAGKNSFLKNKVVLLMHDRMFINKFEGKKNLETLITLLKNNNWKFANIEEYLNK